MPMSTRPIAKPSDPSPTWRASTADGYAGYRKLADRGDVRLAFCWSHVRRNFYEFATPGTCPDCQRCARAYRRTSAPSRRTSVRGADERRAVRQQNPTPSQRT